VRALAERPVRWVFPSPFWARDAIPQEIFGALFDARPELSHNRELRFKDLSILVWLLLRIPPQALLCKWQRRAQDWFGNAMGVFLKLSWDELK
jgi:hypothetical protein